jgi:hypothetical protein
MLIRRVLVRIRILTRWKVSRRDIIMVNFLEETSFHSLVVWNCQWEASSCLARCECWWQLIASWHRAQVASKNPTHKHVMPPKESFCLVHCRVIPSVVRRRRRRRRWTFCHVCMYKHPTINYCTFIQGMNAWYANDDETHAWWWDPERE